MKKFKLLAIFALLAIACNEQDGHGGNDEMYGNTNQNAASDNDEHGNDVSRSADANDTIKLINDSTTNLQNDTAMDRMHQR